MHHFPRTCAVLACLSQAACVQAAGGHHAVDDAPMLAPGECQFEAWAEPVASRQALHLGPACRVGAVEWGLALDRTSPHGEPALRSVGLQAKWATELWPSLSVGLAWSAAWQSVPPHGAGQALLLPVSWAATPTLTLHLNLGRDFKPGARDATRRGVALELLADPQWQALVEGWDDGARSYRRLGLRYVASSQLSLDLSHAGALRGPSDGWWTLGLTWVGMR